MALAMQLDPKKFEVTILERAPTFRNDGFSIILWESGRVILEQLVGPTLKKLLTPIESVDFYVGEPIKMVWSLGSKTIASTIKRQEIVDQLSSKLLKKHPGIDIRFNTEIASVTQKDEEALVSFNNGPAESFGLVILAEGANSITRDKHFETEQSTEPYFARYQWLKTKHRLKNIAVYSLTPGLCYFMQTVGDSTVLGYYTNDSPESEAKVLEGLNTIDWIKKADIEIDRNTVHDFIIKTIKPHTGFKGRMILIGDCYHAHAPTIGYGTSLALEDSTTLANALNNGDISDIDKLNRELHIYEKERRNRISLVYGFQDVVEKLGINDSNIYLNTIRELIQFGGAQTLEAWLYKIVHYSVKKPKIDVKVS